MDILKNKIKDILNPKLKSVAADMMESKIQTILTFMKKSLPSIAKGSSVYVMGCWKQVDERGKEICRLIGSELAKITNLDGCFTCIKQEVIDGVLFHEKDAVMKFFVIDREIPVMYPLELRDASIEQNFINRN